MRFESNKGKYAHVLLQLHDCLSFHIHCQLPVMDIARISDAHEGLNLIDPEIYSRFVKTVIMKPFLEYLPDDVDDKLKNRYLELFLQEVEKSRNASVNSNNKSQAPWSLDLVRLNIIADKCR